VNIFLTNNNPKILIQDKQKKKTTEKTGDPGSPAKWLQEQR